MTLRIEGSMFQTQSDCGKERIVLMQNALCGIVHAPPSQVRCHSKAERCHSRVHIFPEQKPYSSDAMRQMNSTAAQHADQTYSERHDLTIQ